MDFKKEIEKYVPYNEQEEKDKQIILKYMNTFSDVLTRENEMGHMTSSAWVINKQRTKVLMIYHNIYQSWSWPGGHADGQSNLLEVAIKETKEETGVSNVIPINDNIFSLEVLAIDGHKKRGKYIASHVHLNVTYLLEVDDNEALTIREDENSGAKWISLENVTEETTEKCMCSIYEKLIEKLKLNR